MYVKLPLTNGDNLKRKRNNNLYFVHAPCCVSWNLSVKEHSCHRQERTKSDLGQNKCKLLLSADEKLENKRKTKIYTI
jgi:hypothetical protein